MKVTAYLRVAKTEKSGRNRQGVRFAVGSNPDQRPLETDRYVLPTVAFAIDLDIPDEAFEAASRVVAELVVPNENLQIAAEVKEPEEDDG